MMVVYARNSLVLFILCLNVVSFFVADSLVLRSCNSRVDSHSPCYNGVKEINSSKCECYPGWYGDVCQYCGGKMRYDILNLHCTTVVPSYNALQ